MIEGILADARIEQDARTRYASSESYQAQLISKYRRYHRYYQPRLEGDQWPEDKELRPGKIHVTVNVCKAAVDVEARLTSILPRVTCPQSHLEEDERLRAEAAEQLVLTWLELSGWDVWMPDLCKVKCAYGKAVLKPFWDDDLKRPDVYLIENPANLRIGWATSDFRRMDWALYEYAISPAEAMRQYPRVRIMPPERSGQPPRVVVGSDHADPLEQKGVGDQWATTYREPSEYEQGHVKVWDYWYKDPDGTVQNCILVGGVLAEGPFAHREMPDLPYIVIENDHEPGSPEGVSSLDALIDIQIEMNRLVSHGLQHVADDVDPAWYATGPSADTIPPGTVPKAGEIIGAGENRIELIPKGTNTFPIKDMLSELWNEFHRVSGLPEILFGQVPGADVSGRAIAIQIEAAANRLDPRRRRLYQGLRDLIVFWTIMAERKNPKVDAAQTEEGDTLKASVGDMVRGFRRWKIIAPEITPRDAFEQAQNQINLVNARLTSRAEAMDQVGIESPEAMKGAIRDEQMDPMLNPEAVQAYVAIFPILQQVMSQQQAMQQQVAELAAQGQGGMSPTAQAQSAANGMQNAAQSAQPTGVEDQNQPMTQAGMAPPPGAGAQGPAATTLIRGGEALNQLAFNSQPLGA